MSAGQLLVTVGVALWVFDPKKMPVVLSHVVRAIAMFRQYYTRIAQTMEQILQRELHQQTLVNNQLKAQQAEDQHSE